MWYQLPNGKTIWLDINDIIDLTDDDIQFLISNDYGEVVYNPFSKSVIEERRRKEPVDYMDDDDEDEEYNTSEDYPDYSDDVDISDIID